MHDLLATDRLGWELSVINERIDRNRERVFAEEMINIMFNSFPKNDNMLFLDCLQIL